MFTLTQDWLNSRSAAQTNKDSLPVQIKLNF